MKIRKKYNIGTFFKKEAFSEKKLEHQFSIKPKIAFSIVKVFEF
jgi:hypothetical protein